MVDSESVSMVQSCGGTVGLVDREAQTEILLRWGQWVMVREPVETVINLLDGIA